MTSPGMRQGSTDWGRSDCTHEIPQDEDRPLEEEDREEPGLVLIFAASQPAHAIVPLGEGALDIGREHPSVVPFGDTVMSRTHARVAFRDGAFAIQDLGSRNGSALDGRSIHDRVRARHGQALRLGQSVFLLCSDVRPYARYGVRAEKGRVEGPTLQRALASVASVARHSRTLFIAGESGSGKEGMALAFHRAGAEDDGPFVAVNCATLPEGVAERLLFGTQRGAYSGATHDSEGYVQAADGGTLFLDEIADLDRTVQAKLLRVLESGEVTPLGATRPRKVRLRVCSATNADLRALLNEQRFRADLYFRVGVPQVRVPPLRERPEEIPWLVVKAVREVDRGLRVHSSLVEASLSRVWPGNVRELLAEAHTAALSALSDGSASVSVRHLNLMAGAALGSTAKAPSERQPERSTESPEGGTGAPSSRAGAAQMLDAMLAHRGNLSAAARALGVHRTQLRRALASVGIDPRTIRASFKA